MVGVAPPSFGGSAVPVGGDPAPAFGAPPAAGDHQTFGSAADANPLAGTMALDGPPNFANITGAPLGGAPPAFGAPPPDAGGGFNPAPFGAPPPDAGGGFVPPPQPGADPYGAPVGGMGGPPPGGNMGGQAVQFFGNIGFDGNQGQLLRKAGFVHTVSIGQNTGQSVTQTGI